ncbi:MAG: Glu/Leu/Phe/Val dehydrogenase dimerization domain-containing protein [Saprospiraceae bacterium]
MDELLNKYKEKRPTIVFEWSDEETNAEGWIVINSLRNGAAGGGTRMRKGLTKEEVVSLAKVMEIKFAVCGPPIGGAKSGINFDPNDPRKDEVLKRWYKAVLPILQSYYGTGGDLNIDEVKDVIPITEDLGLWHPQEGVVNGHLQLSKGAKLRSINNLRNGCIKVVDNLDYVPDAPEDYVVADMITGFGVAESVKHFYDLFLDQPLTGKRVIIQGWGNVASAAAFYLSKAGAKIVGIIDKNFGIVEKDGLKFAQIKSLFINKKGNKLYGDNMLSFKETNERIWTIGADIFIPGAASKIVTRNQVDEMIEHGLQVISCGANVPFIDDEVFFGPTAKYTDEKISVIPDFVANCGMARVFAYLMQSEAEITDEAIFGDVSEIIRNFLEELKTKDPTITRISGRALRSVLGQLV